MKANYLWAGLLIGVGAISLAIQAPAPPQNTPPPLPAPAPPPGPCGPGPCPAPKPKRPWGENPREAGQPQLAGKVSPDGTEEIMIDLPASQKKKNVGGRDGAGLCVFTAIEYAARWQNERLLIEFQKQMRPELGGGWPGKVDEMMKKYAPGVKYLQHTGGDMAILKAAFRSGRAPCVTYAGYDPHYGGGIDHMVTAAHLSEKWAAITDNNFTGDNDHVWMSPAEFEKRWKARGGGWCVILLAPPPPPIPRNGK